MSRSQNKVFLSGNIGKIDTFSTQGGVSKTTVFLAINESYKDKVSNEWKDKTDWFNVVFWGKLAESVAKLRKGLRLEVEGKLKTRFWDDKQSGQKRYVTEILAESYIPSANLTKDDLGNSTADAQIADPAAPDATFDEYESAGAASMVDIPF
jgi:single-strand DNA-binding protein